MKKIKIDGVWWECRKCIRNRDTIQATDIWVFSRGGNAAASKCAGVGQKYRNDVPLYRPIRKVKTKPKAKKRICICTVPVTDARKRTHCYLCGCRMRWAQNTKTVAKPEAKKLGREKAIGEDIRLGDTMKNGNPYMALCGDKVKKAGTVFAPVVKPTAKTARVKAWASKMLFDGGDPERWFTVAVSYKPSDNHAYVPVWITPRGTKP